MFKLPELPYQFSALEPFIDEATMEIHHGKHHATYVKNLNDTLSTLPSYENKTIEEILMNLQNSPGEVREKLKNSGGGHFNHSLFWQIMKPANQVGRLEGELKEAVVSQFGDQTTFQEKFTTAALNRFGSGWVWLVWDKGKLSITDTPNQDNPVMNGIMPILGLDVWEHAYYLKYQNRRADYIVAWWNVVDWGEVGKRFDMISK
jgi:superoxide dismutase, Fe-Mn family